MIGIHKDLPIEQYHNHKESISRSGLVEFRKSPYHFWAHHLNPNRPPKKATPAMIIGNAFHTLVLENSKFSERYIEEMPTLETLGTPLRLKDVGREAYDADQRRREQLKDENEKLRAEFEANAVGKTILSTAEMRLINDMLESLATHPQASALVRDALYEHSLFWNDPHTGLLVKARPDIWHDGILCDLKTIESADERSFQRAIADGIYHIQAAMQIEGVKELTGKEIKSFVFIVCEKKYPYICVPYILDEYAIERGLVDYKNTLLDLKQCFETNTWRGYETKTISLPSWMN